MTHDAHLDIKQQMARCPWCRQQSTDGPVCVYVCGGRRGADDGRQAQATLCDLPDNSPSARTQKDQTRFEFGNGGPELRKQTTCNHYSLLTPGVLAYTKSSGAMCSEPGQPEGEVLGAGCRSAQEAAALARNKRHKGSRQAEGTAAEGRPQ